MTKVVTFYSYKGGVGRTMALVNVAHVLARDGWRVLMVDFDLEAPGMTHFFAEQVRKRPKTVKHDALDLLLHAKSTIGWDPAEKKSKPLEIPKSLAEYVVSIPLPDKWKDKVIPYRTGRLDLLPATLELVEPEEATEAKPSRDFLRRMDKLDLPGVFDEGGPRHHFGNHVRQYFVNARFKTKGDILFTLRDQVWAAYDLVLVDSRTGLNEVAGLCIGPLCGALVICTSLNDQSIYGTKYFMKKAGLFDRDKAKPYALVAGPVPLWHTREAHERIALLRKELRADEVVEIPYHPAAALIEKRFILDEPKEPITHAFERLAPVVERLPGLQVEDEPKGWAMDVVSRARRGETTWSDAQREVAQRLRHYFSPELHRRIAPIGILAPFPSAATFSAPRQRRGGWVEHLGWPGIPFAAAVSAYRLHSERPFRRAWQLIGTPGKSESKVFLGVRLLFLQLRVLGTLPKREVGYPILRSARMFANRWTTSEWLNENTAVWLIDLLMTVHSLRERQSRWRMDVGLATLDKWTASARTNAARFGTAWPLPLRPWGVKADDWPRCSVDQLWDLGVALVKGAPPNDELLEPVRRPMPFEHSPAELGRMWGELMHPELLREVMRRESQGGRAWLHAPLGLWGEPLMATAVALANGPIKEILGWLMLARYVYGYAWRVLVDWRHLASVKDHPLFVEFIRQEDEMVNEIEGAIDRGEYTL